jgi:hypothetical protein
MAGLIEKLVAFARRHQYEHKQMGRDTLVIQKSGTWRILTGLSASLRILVSAEPGKTEVTFCDYQKEFSLKMFGSVLTFFIGNLIFFSYSTSSPLPILLVISFPMYGAFRQYRLMEAIKAEIDDYFAR